MTYEMIPTGYYDATVTGIGADTSTSGHPQIVVGFTLDAYPETSLRAWLHMSPKAAPHTIKKLAVLGVRDLANLDAAQGNRCSVQVTHDTYQGETRERIGWINPEGYTGPSISHDTKAAAGLAAFQGLLDQEVGEAADDGCPF